MSSTLGPAGIVGGGSECTALFPPSIQRLRSPWAKHRTLITPRVPQHKWLTTAPGVCMNEWCIYIALYCVLLYTQSTLQSGGGGVSPQPPPVCIIHLDDATAATGQQLTTDSALTTHQIQVERRESHRDNQVYALTTHQLQVEKRESHRVNQVYALTTPATGGEERES